MGGCLKVIYGPEDKETFFPFNSDSFVSLTKTKELKKWISMANTSSKGEPVPNAVFDNIAYVGGHKAFTENKRGMISINSTTFSFQEIKGIM